MNQAELTMPKQLINDTCNFCRANGRLRDPIMASSDQAYVIQAASSPENLLIIPNTHYESLADLPDDWWLVVKNILAELQVTGDYNFSINLGPQAGQSMKHLHFWLVPRTGGKLSSGKGLAALITELDGQA